MKMTLKAAAALALAAPFSATLLFAQTTGVSHPDEIPITTSSEGVAAAGWCTRRLQQQRL